MKNVKGVWSFTQIPLYVHTQIKPMSYHYQLMLHCLLPNLQPHKLWHLVYVRPWYHQPCHQPVEWEMVKLHSDRWGTAYLYGLLLPAVSLRQHNIGISLLIGYQIHRQHPLCRLHRKHKNLSTYTCYNYRLAATLLISWQTRLRMPSYFCVTKLFKRLTCDEAHTLCIYIHKQELKIREVFITQMLWGADSTALLRHHSSCHVQK